MAVFRNVMAFLGLDDDDQVYDDEAYYDEDAEEPDRRAKASGRSRTIAVGERLEAVAPSRSFGFAVEGDAPEVGGVGAVRPLRSVPAADPDQEQAIDRRSTVGRAEPPADAGPTHADPMTGFDAPPSGAAIEGAPLERAELGVDQSARPPAVSPSRPPQELQTTVVTHAKPRLHIPSSFDEASRVADDFRAGSPVVMNLSAVDKPVARRLIDFASGVCYVLSGGMERLAANVYLLTPHGVDVSPEDRRRMHERGFNR